MSNLKEATVSIEVQAGVDESEILTNDGRFAIWEDIENKTIRFASPFGSQPLKLEFDEYPDKNKFRNKRLITYGNLSSELSHYIDDVINEKSNHHFHLKKSLYFILLSKAVVNFLDKLKIDHDKDEIVYPGWYYCSLMSVEKVILAQDLVTFIYKTAYGKSRIGKENVKQKITTIHSSSKKASFDDCGDYVSINTKVTKANVGDTDNNCIGETSKIIPIPTDITKNSMIHAIKMEKVKMLENILFAGGSSFVDKSDTIEFLHAIISLSMNPIS